MQTLLTIWLTVVSAVTGGVEHVPDDFPRFVVPGHEREMASLRSLLWLHSKNAGPLIPLWDEWMAMSTLWPARGDGAALNAMRQRWATALASRVMNDEGYVHTQQHDGLGHAEGWPFPLWTQAGGVGWHFRGTGVAGYDAPQVEPTDWQIVGGAGGDVGDAGWTVELTDSGAQALTPEFRVDAARAPWLRLNWRPGTVNPAGCYVEWTTDEQPQFSAAHRVYAGSQSQRKASAGATPPSGEVRTMVPVYRSPGWRGVITGLRIGFENAGPATVVIKSFHTASDTRHNVNNLNFIRGCYDYFVWTHDVSFLRAQMPRMRKAMHFVEREFQTRKRKCIYTTWPGHEGRTGVQWVDGRKSVLPGVGVGSNYWDLLPFGGEDALATIYYYDTLLDLAELEEAIAQRPDWKIPPDETAYDPVDLRKHARQVKSYGGRRFWNPTTGRFGTVDLDGVMHDYGFTFLNNEAVHFDFATAHQAESIYAWLSGRRSLADDTSTGTDLYRWRFGPRSTTRRNIDYYFWGWSNPESVPWGDQVQDGGAVLGWSYYDLMARLKTAGPDDAATRLAEIIAWFDDVQSEGGYRSYYGKQVDRGSLQGGGTPGGLGLDHEFFESVLVPQVMLYGFLGFRPTVSGFAMSPNLPADWPELTVTRIYVHDCVLDVTAKQGGGVRIVGVTTLPAAQTRPIVVEAAASVSTVDAEGVRVKVVKADGR